MRKQQIRILTLGRERVINNSNTNSNEEEGMLKMLIPWKALIFQGVNIMLSTFSFH
jgi:hypothetical protein